MSAVTELPTQAHNEDKDAALFVEGKAEASANEHSPEYREYLRLENEVFVGKKKKTLIRKMDLRVVAPLVVGGRSSVFV
jgi:hypothetical protein